MTNQRKENRQNPKMVRKNEAHPTRINTTNPRNEKDDDLELGTEARHNSATCITTSAASTASKGTTVDWLGSGEEKVASPHFNGSENCSNGGGEEVTPPPVLRQPVRHSANNSRLEENTPDTSNRAKHQK